MKVYACSRHHQRGSSVCPVTVYQPMDDVEGALVDYISRHVLTERVLDEVLAEIRGQIDAQLPKREADISGLEAELEAFLVPWLGQSWPFRSINLNGQLKSLQGGANG